MFLILLMFYILFSTADSDLKRKRRESTGTGASSRGTKVKNGRTSTEATDVMFMCMGTLSNIALEERCRKRMLNENMVRWFDCIGVILFCLFFVLFLFCVFDFGVFVLCFCSLFYFLFLGDSLTPLLFFRPVL